MSIRKILPTILLTAASMVPMKTASTRMTSTYSSRFLNMPVPTTPLKKAERVVKGMEVIADTNFMGGITHKFKNEDIDSLRKIIKRDVTVDDYTAPIKNGNNVFVEPFGMFFAKRPGDRPHLGLDIFVSPLAKKPKNPVPVLAPLDGIVISYKNANPNDNLISNCAGMLGIDGRTYMFDHLARKTDYKTFVEPPKVGKIISKGDTIGYVGHTGETELWHLHLVVKSNDRIKTQEADTVWQNYKKKSPYVTISGQSDPLNEKESGLISVKLNEYKKQNLQLKNQLLLPYNGREHYLK